MGFLNNLFSYFSSYNSILINSFSVIFIIFIENPLKLKLVKLVSDLKTSTKQNVLYVILLSVFMVCLEFFIDNNYNIFIGYIFNFILIYFIFKMNLFKTFLTMSISILIFMFSYIFVLVPFIKIFNISYLMIQQIPLYYITFLLIFYAIVALFLIAINYTKFKIDSLDCLNRKSKILFTIYNIFSISLIYIFVNNCLKLDENIFVNYIFTIFYFIGNMVIYILITKYSSLKLDLEVANNYNQVLSNINDTVRAFKHDFANIIASIGGFISTNDMLGLKKFYLSLETDYNELNNLYTLNPELISNSGVYNLLNQKYNLAVSNGIKFNLSYFVDINNFNISIYELTRILGILIDNAIDAAKSSHEKILNVSFKSEPKKHRNVIVVQNSYLDKNLDIDDIFRKGITSKVNHTGLGLWEVKKILSKNPNLDLYTSKDDLLFTQQLEIYDC